MVSQSRTLDALTGIGRFGVPVFFVLSAFLITRLLLIEREQTGKVDLRAYYVRRTLRIWPLYFLVLAVGLIAAHHLGEPTRGPLLPLATFTANWYYGRGGLIPSPLVPLWSVSVEEQFYVVWPFVLTLFPRRWLAALCGAMVVAAPVARIVVAHHDRSGMMLWLATTTHLDSLALGTLLALNSDRLPTFSRIQGSTLLALCLGGMFLENLFFPLLQEPPTIRGCVAYTVVPFLCATIVAVAIGTRDSLLAHPRVAAVGRMTYGLYMWHVIPIALLAPHTLFGLAVCLLIAVLLATATYYGYERPFLKLKNRFERIRTRTT